ncbi:hypothetical protein EK21DRAFT_89637 [Setomelanomma holmii]|uniref:Uncharacterized protein n=1 Tax=Setomelanomma holmii TaxID=210430 RepID=A0A9P4H9V5_9PLEO|nr:hypothetical protein EK21DRAFT_89637 [Setomelanomma holmii]
MPRWQRHRAIDPDTRRELEVDRLHHKMSYQINGNDTGHFDWLHSLLDYYDARAAARVNPPRVGPDELHLWTPVYRRTPVGLPTRINTDEIGRGRIVDGEEQFEYDTGHENEEREPLDFDLDEDEIEVKRQRVDNTDKDLEDDETVAPNHSVRREEEIQLFPVGGIGPSTSNVLTQTTSNGKTTYHPWRSIRTAKGLFMFAKETSWDWLTSYDCLGPIARRDIPSVLHTSAVRDETSTDSDEDDDMIWERNYLPEEDQELSKFPDDGTQDRAEPKVPVEVQPAKKKTKKKKKRRADSYASKKRRKKTPLPESVEAEARSGTGAEDGTGTEGGTETEGEIEVEGGAGIKGGVAEVKGGVAEVKGGVAEVKGGVAEVKGGVAEVKGGVAEVKGGTEAKTVTVVVKKDDDSWKRRRANIDYPYRKKEFKKEKDPQEGRLAGKELHLEITDWAEETDGRREWHAYGLLSPFSAADSPPRTPIREDDLDPLSIPRMENKDDPKELWRVMPDGDMPPLERSRRRCQTEKCRAWWQHPTEECLVVHSEKTERPKPPEDTEQPNVWVEAYLRTIHRNDMLERPEGGIGIYPDRLSDHYGLRQPEEQKTRWPKLGIRVPYDPMTFDDCKPDPEKAKDDKKKKDDVAKTVGGIIAKDAHNRTLQSMRSMDVPIMKDTQRDWGVVDADPPPNSGDKDDDEESDDETDLFRIACDRGSGTAGGDAPTSNPTEPP